MNINNITSLDQLLNQTVDFYGVDFNKFCVGIDNSIFIFEAVEDEGDGYRSMMEDVYLLHANYKGKIKDGFGIFFKSPIAKCIINKTDRADLNGYELVDVENKHVWLEFGTDDSDNWYPIFTFYYQPREDQLINKTRNK